MVHLRYRAMFRRGQTKTFLTPNVSRCVVRSNFDLFEQTSQDQLLQVPRPETQPMATNAWMN